MFTYKLNSAEPLRQVGTIQFGNGRSVCAVCLRQRNLGVQTSCDACRLSVHVGPACLRQKAIRADFGHARTGWVCKNCASSD